MAKEDNKKNPKKVTPSKCPPQSSPSRPEEPVGEIGSKATSKDAPKQDTKHEKTVRTRLQRRQDQIVASTTSPQILSAESNPSKTSTSPATSKKTQITASDTQIETPKLTQVPAAKEIATQTKAQKAVESLFKKVQPPPVQPKPLNPKAAQRIEIGKTQSAIERIEKLESNVPKILVHPRHQQVKPQTPPLVKVASKTRVAFSTSAPSDQTDVEIFPAYSPERDHRVTSTPETVPPPVESFPLLYQSPANSLVLSVHSQKKNTIKFVNCLINSPIVKSLQNLMKLKNSSVSAQSL